MASAFWDRNRSLKAQKEIARIAASAGLDAKAVNILFNTYFDADDDIGGGWIAHRSRRTPPDDFEYAKAHGVMADPLVLDHDGLIARLIEMRDRLDRRSISDGFLVSLEPTRFDLRSTLGSYAAFLSLGPHPYARARDAGAACKVCGLEGDGARAIDVNVNTFLRLKWAGSVHHMHPDYATFDLEQFDRSPRPGATAEHQAILGRVLDVIRGLPADAGLAESQKGLTGLFKGDKRSRQQVLETLGYCGILQPTGRPSLRTMFTDAHDREQDQPTNYWKREWTWPVQHWAAADGIDEAAVRFWFPDAPG